MFFGIMKQIIISLLLFFPLTVQSLNLEQATERALLWSPVIKNIETDLQKIRLDRKLVGKMPNPAFDASFAPVTDRCCATTNYYGIRQIFETAHKTRKRVEITYASENVLHTSLSQAQIDLIAQVYHTFIDCYMAQEIYALKKELFVSSEENYKRQKELAENGRFTLFEDCQNHKEFSLAQVELNKSRAVFETKKRELAILWGGTLDFNQLELDDEPLEEINYAQLESYVDSYPEVIKKEYQIKTLQKTLKLEKANAVPNVEIFAGVNTCSSFHRSNLEMGFTVPLPIYQQNQTMIGKVKLEIQDAIYELQALKAKIKSELESAHILYYQIHLPSVEIMKRTYLVAKHALEEMEVMKDSLCFEECVKAKKHFYDISIQFFHAKSEALHAKVNLLKLLNRCEGDE